MVVASKMTERWWKLVAGGLKKTRRFCDRNVQALYYLEVLKCRRVMLG